MDDDENEGDGGSGFGSCRGLILEEFARGKGWRRW